VEIKTKITGKEVNYKDGAFAADNGSVQRVFE
jgi:hypothetical protein